MQTDPVPNGLEHCILSWSVVCCGLGAKGLAGEQLGIPDRALIGAVKNETRRTHSKLNAVEVCMGQRSRLYNFVTRGTGIGLFLALILSLALPIPHPQPADH